MKPIKIKTPKKLSKKQLLTQARSEELENQLERLMGDESLLMSSQMTSQTTAASSSKGQTKANLTTGLGNHGIILHKHSTIVELYSLSGSNAK